MNRMKGGIYCIENLVNGKMYIGQASNFENRKHEHSRSLKGNYHRNPHLQNSYNKYGEINFKFRILLYCEPIPDELTRYEQFFVDSHDPEMLYNIRLECVDSSLGIEPSEETREKISEANSGKNHYLYGKHLSKETKEKMSKAHTGKPLSKKHREKISESHIGKHLSEQHKKKISNALSGKNNPFYEKHHSEETRQRMSESNSGGNNPFYGKEHSEETKKKMSKAAMGRNLSEEAKQKISKANSGENHPRSKLTEQQVFEILDLKYNKKTKLKNIVKKYGVSMGTISGICYGTRWKSCYKEFMREYKNE